MTEADICRIYITPALKAAGWTDEQIREQVTFTDGCILPASAPFPAFCTCASPVSCQMLKFKPGKLEREA